jgi:TolB-like protein
MERRGSGTDPPIRVRTLGSVQIDGPDAAAAARVASQPKRVALLAFLAARPHGEQVSRDRILATFWPESDATKARAGLRNALYFLRTTLGTDAIPGTRHRVWTSPDRVSCDATQFLVAGEAGSGVAEAAALMRLYRGEFLDGLYVSGAPDFERWVDRMRAALRARATELEWRLSEAAESQREWISAAAHARRAADLAVDVEGATQRLLRLLDRAGDRAAAVAVYDGLVARLRDEYETTPSPETSSLMREIRERQRPHVPDPLPAPITTTSDTNPSRAVRSSVAVLPFVDLSGTGGPLAAGLFDDLLTALSRLRGVRVVSRTSVQRFAFDRPESVRAVREVLGVDMVLEGSVRVAGRRARVTIRLDDAERDEQLWAETYDRDLTDIFEVQSDVAMRIARALGAELSPREHRGARAADVLRRPRGRVDHAHRRGYRGDSRFRVRPDAPDADLRRRLRRG